MQVAVAQLNLTVGALEHNTQRLLEAWHVAQRAGARVVLTPELSLCGYAPEDLLLRKAFLDDCAHVLKALATQIDKGVLIVGFPEYVDGKCYNVMAVLRKRKIDKIYRKQILTKSEARYFCAGKETITFRETNTHFALLFGSDLSGTAARNVSASGAQVTLVADARAYTMNDEVAQSAWLGERAKRLKLPMIVAQPVGGQDAQVFMGASLAIDRNGSRVQTLPAWQESVALVRIKRGVLEARSNFNDESAEYHVYQALVTALRDYVRKNNFEGVLLGLSGGIDSALVMALAVDALGADRVHAYRLPSPYTRQESLIDAERMATSSNVSLGSIALKPLMTAMDKALAPVIDAPLNDLAAQNIQARLRALLLMSLSNQNHWLLLATGNKSESATGYATLYGDMAGGFAPIKDLTKTWVYKLARYRNTLGRLIPERVLTRAPSAELKLGQTDQDSLPPYAALDAIIEAYVERGEDAAALLKQGFAAADIEKTLKLLKDSEYKRQQATPGPCITERAFDDDWRYPLTSKWQDKIQRGKSDKTKQKTKADDRKKRIK
ncbi:MAG: NAD+ synthase [Burkholderiales bacterium]|jgi:NAD+ synthetase|nr:NAD+ synthase [Burkholderiales bacterium]